MDRVHPGRDVTAILRRGSALAIGLVALLTGGFAWGQTTPPSPAATPPASTAAASPSACGACLAPASAIETVARGVVRGLGQVPDGLVVGSAPIVSAEPARSEADGASTDDSLASLRDRILRLVVGKLGAEARAVDAGEPAALLEAAEDALGYVLLSPRIAGGRLIVGADAYAVPRTVWARARQIAPRPVRHAQAQAPLDAEVRAHLAPLAFAEGGPTVTKLKDADPDVHALACGDLDADGLNDMITVTRQRVLRVRLDRRAGQVVRLAELRWDDAAPIAPVPLRHPLAFATIVEGPTVSHRRGHLDVTITDRRGSLRLDPALEVIARVDGKAVPHAGRSACTWTMQLMLGEKVRACHQADGPPALPELGRRADAMASMFLVGPDGRAAPLVALREGNLLVLWDGAEARRLARVGAQLAMGDLDQDGAPELVTTVDTLAPKYDAVEVSSLGDDGKLERRYRLRVPRGVEAVATCPSDGRGLGAVLVATGGEIWEVR